MRSNGIRVGPHPNDWCPYESGAETERHKGKIPCEHGGKDWSDMSITAKDRWQPLEARREAWDVFSLRTSTRNQPH